MIDQLRLVREDLDKLGRSATNRTYGVKGEDRRLAFKLRNHIRTAERAMVNAIITQRQMNGELV